MIEMERNAARIQQILEERARALAAVPEEEVKEAFLELLVIGLGKGKFGIRINQIVEILPLKNVSYIPGIAAWWTGLINLRSNLVPLLDLREYLDFPSLAKDENKEESALQAKRGEKNNREIVIISNGRHQLGLLVDTVFNVQKVFIKEINPPLEKNEISNIKVVEGVTPDLITILDMDQLFKDSRLIVQEITN